MDFYIAVECGFLSTSGEKQISIISKDKGFAAIADFFHIKSEFNTRRKLIKERTKMLNIDAEQARIVEHRAFVEKITKIFAGTEYERETDKILHFTT